MSLDKLLEDAVKNPIQRLVFMQKLVKSKVLVIGKTTIQKDAQGQETSTVSLMSIRNSKGEKAAPFFTSEEKLMEFLKTFTTRTPPVMQTDCIDFFRLSAHNNANVVLNPNCEYSTEYSAKEIQALVGGTPFVTNGLEINKDDKGSITYPKKYPQELTDSLSEFFAAKENVNNAYVYEIKYSKNVPHILLVIDFDGDRTELFTEIAKVAEKFLKSEKDNIDIVSSDESLCEEIKIERTPFYSKRNIKMN